MVYMKNLKVALGAGFYTLWVDPRGELQGKRYINTLATFKRQVKSYAAFTNSKG